MKTGKSEKVMWNYPDLLFQCTFRFHNILMADRKDSEIMISQRDIVMFYYVFQMALLVDWCRFWLPLGFGPKREYRIVCEAFNVRHF
jgi:hypothetical protein